MRDEKRVKNKRKKERVLFSVSQKDKLGYSGMILILFCTYSALFFLHIFHPVIKG